MKIKLWLFAAALTYGLVGTLKGQNLFVANGGGTTIGEYGLDGSVVNGSLISGPYDLDAPWGVAISGSYLFVANAGSGAVGEYTTSGATVNASLISGLISPWGVAISGNDLFVANYGTGTVGKYTTSGATIATSLVSGLNAPTGIAIGAVPEPSAVALAGLGGTALWLCRCKQRKVVLISKT